MTGTYGFAAILPLKRIVFANLQQPAPGACQACVTHTSGEHVAVLALPPGQVWRFVGQPVAVARLLAALHHARHHGQVAEAAIEDEAMASVMKTPTGKIQKLACWTASAMVRRPKVRVSTGKVLQR